MGQTSWYGQLGSACFDKEPLKRQFRRDCDKKKGKGIRFNKKKILKFVALYHFHPAAILYGYNNNNKNKNIQYNKEHSKGLHGEILSNRW